MAKKDMIPAKEIDTYMTDGQSDEIKALLSEYKDKLATVGAKQKIKSVKDENSLSLIDAKLKFKFRLLDDGTYEITGKKGNKSQISIPELIGGVKVTSIGSRAFDEDIFADLKVVSFVIPDSVSKIGNSAFSSCSKLKEITIPKRVMAISEGTFWGCRSLEKAVLPPLLTSIGDSAFRNCTSLVSLTIPDGVTSIDRMPSKTVRALQA